MASEVSICNLALGHLGEGVVVTSIDPPDGSVQAALCAQFYPIARDTMLEMHNWNFATRRATLAQLSSNPTSTWQYAFALPSDVKTAIDIIPADAIDDYAAPMYSIGMRNPEIGLRQPQPYVIESTDSGSLVLLTDMENPVLRYQAAITDPGRFSALFIQGLSLLLSSHLAGPIIKGVEGTKAEAARLQVFEAWFARATEHDSNQRRLDIVPQNALLVNR